MKSESREKTGHRTGLGERGMNRTDMWSKRMLDVGLYVAAFLCGALTLETIYTLLELWR